MRIGYITIVLCGLALGAEEKKKDDKWLPKGRPFQTIKSEITSLESDVAALKGIDQTLKDDIQALSDQVSSSSDTIEALELNVLGLEDEVNTNTHDISTLEAQVTTLQMELDTVRTDVTVFTTVYHDKVALIEVEIANINQLITTELALLATKTDVADIVANLVTVTAYQQDVALLLASKEDLETLKDDLNGKVGNLQSFDARLKFLVNQAGTFDSLFEETICIWDYFGGCKFNSDMCTSRYARFPGPGLQSKTFAVGADVPTSIEVNAVGSCSTQYGFEATYTVYLNDVNVGTFNEGRHCTCVVPHMSIKISADQIAAANVVADQPSTITIAYENTYWLAEFYANINYPSGL